MNKSVMLLVTGMLAAGSLFADDATGDVSSIPVLPGWGKYFWNRRSMQYIYPPAFDFKEVKGAANYRYRVEDDQGGKHEFTAPTPKTSLASVWHKLPPKCIVNLRCEAVDAQGGSLGEVGRKEFWKSAAFREGAYPKAKRGYAEASRMTYDYIFSMPYVKTLAETGKPDPKYRHNCYPAKMNSSLIKAAIRYAKLAPAKRDKVLKVARAAADYLIATADPVGSPLEFFPQTYDKEIKYMAAVRFAGQNVLIHPAQAGEAFVELHRVTKETKYLEAAERIAATYLKLQGEDGTWYLKMWAKDGKPVNKNRLFPLAVCEFLEALYAVTSKTEYRVAADRAFAYIEKGPLAIWNWEGQFEDVEPSALYQNLTKHSACATAMYLLKRYPGDRQRLAEARGLLRFSEDQFVVWERPCNDDGSGWFGNPKLDPRKWTVFPTALEQYGWYIPTDASVGKLVVTYLALYEASGDKTDLAKAKALGDAYTRAQEDSGRIPTQWTTGSGATTPSSDWINCMLYSASALDRLATVEAFSIRDYGADTEATPKENAAAIQRAIDAAAAAGGGRVTVSGGKYNIGTIWLKNNVELHLEEDAWLVGSADLADYNADDAYPGNWGCPAEGWSAKHLIIAYDVRNVAVTGPGTIDGNGSAFFRGRPYYGRGNYGWRHGMRHTANRKDSYRPGQELVFVNCRDVRVENVFFQEMACWTCFFYCCDRVRVKGCTIRTQLSYANADGFDVDRCRDVVITGCDIETADDCLTVRASGAATRLCEDIVFSNCVCRCSASGVRIGVGTGEIRKVRISDLDMREAGNGIVIQSAYPSKDRKPGTGVTIHDIDFDNIRMRETGLAVLITSGAPDTEATISDLRFTDINAETMGAIILDGCAAKPIENVVFNGLSLEIRSRDFPWAKNWQVVTTNCDHEAAIWVDHAKGVRFDRTAVKFAHDRDDTRSKLFSIVNSEDVIK